MGIAAQWQWGQERSMLPQAPKTPGDKNLLNLKNLLPQFVIYPQNILRRVCSVSVLGWVHAVSPGIGTPRRAAAAVPGGHK